MASGTGVTVLPASSIPDPVPRDSLLAYVPFAPPVPERRIALIYRKSFPRKTAMETLRQAVLNCNLPGTRVIEAA